MPNLSMCGDKPYDSDKLAGALLGRGVEKVRRIGCIFEMRSNESPLSKDIALTDEITKRLDSLNNEKIT
jgi:hypothetical protein